MTDRVNKKPVVFINQSAGYLMIDIVNAFVEKGFQCSLIAGIIVERQQLLNKRVKVHKIVKYNRKSAIRRLLTWLTGTVQIFFRILFFYRQAHLFIVSNPPTAIMLPLMLRNTYSYLIFDIYPDALTELGFIKEKSLINSYWQRANRKLFPQADEIFTITEGMKELLESYSGQKKVKVVPLWSDNEFLKPVSPEENPFLLENKLMNKFVILYSGNIGITSNVEILADIASQIRNPSICFVVIGGGARENELRRKIEVYKLTNFLIFPWQDVSKLPYTLSAADLGVVTLGKNASKLAIPSKLYSLLSVGVPILGIAGMDSDLTKLIEIHDVGKCFVPDNPGAIIEYIEILSKDKDYLTKLKNNALGASKLYTKENVIKFI